MVDLNVEMAMEPNTITTKDKKRSYEEFLKPQLIMHRFKSKSDFITYFSESRRSLDAFYLAFV